MENNQIDRLFREKFESRTFEPTEEDWKSAHALIRKPGRNRRFLVLWLLGASALMVLTVFGYGWIRQSASTPEIDRENPEIHELRSEPNTELRSQPKKAQSSKEIGPGIVDGSRKENRVKATGIRADHTDHILVAGDAGKSIKPNRNPNAGLESPEPKKISSGLTDRSTIPVVQLEPMEMLLPLQVKNPVFLDFNGYTATAGTKPLLAEKGFQAQAGILANVKNPPKAGARLGLTYLLPVTRTISLTTGILYWWQQSDGLAKVTTETTFEFGMVERHFGLRTDQLHFLAVPLLVNRHFEGWSFNAGIDLDYLVAATGKSELLQVERSIDARNEPVITIRSVLQELQSGWIETDAISKFGFKVTAGVSLELGPKTGIGIQWIYRPNESFSELPNELQQEQLSKHYVGVHLKYFVF